MSQMQNSSQWHQPEMGGRSWADYAPGVFSSVPAPNNVDVEHASTATPPPTHYRDGEPERHFRRFGPEYNEANRKGVHDMVSRSRHLQSDQSHGTLMLTDVLQEPDAEPIASAGASRSERKVSTRIFQTYCYANGRLARMYKLMYDDGSEKFKKKLGLRF